MVLPRRSPSGAISPESAPTSVVAGRRAPGTGGDTSTVRCRHTGKSIRGQGNLLPCQSSACTTFSSCGWASGTTNEDRGGVESDTGSGITR